MTESNYLEDAFRLLRAAGDGVLSTISVTVDGYPFGSITPYCLDYDFVPNILISSIAQHTKNIESNSKVSLTIVEEKEKTNKQSKGRLTYIGDAVLVEDDSKIRPRYLNYFPSASGYFETHDFSFYRIQPKRLRYIGGFGAIHWIEQDQLPASSIFSPDAESGIVEHMNEDHAYNLHDYCRHYLSLEIGENMLVRMQGIDQFGIDIAVDEVKYRIDFPMALTDASQARAQLVEMAELAKA